MVLAIQGEKQIRQLWSSVCHLNPVLWQLDRSQISQIQSVDCMSDTPELKDIIFRSPIS